MLDEVAMRASLDVASPEYVAPLYVYLASDLAQQMSGESFVAASGFVGRYPRPGLEVIGYREQCDSPPWSVHELSGMVDAHARA